MRIKVVASAIVLTAGLLSAGDFWKDKAPETWSEKEKNKLLKGSPWSRVARVTMEGRPGGGDMTGGGRSGRGGRGGGGGGGSMSGGDSMGRPGMPGDSSDAGGGMGRGGSGGGMAASAPPEITVLVRWDSAAAVQHALGSKEQPGDSYVISVIGFPPRRGRGDGPALDLTRFQQALKANTTLRKKGGDPSVPESVEFRQTEQGNVLVFRFPRDKRLSLDDKEIEFASHMGPFHIKTTFKLKDMMYQGKLDV